MVRKTFVGNMQWRAGLAAARWLYIAAPQR